MSDDFQTMPSEYHATQEGLVTYFDRCKKLGQTGLVVWFTGLSGSGKTTIAIDLEKRLFDLGRLVYRLDGDKLRRGLNAGLGFSEAGRRENIRRAAEVAKLFQETGTIVLACFISPNRDMREQARNLLPAGAFLEVYVKASLEACVARDPKGYYRKAMNNEIKDYIGIAQAYEEPLNPELVLDTEKMSLAACVERVLNLIMARSELNNIQA